MSKPPFTEAERAYIEAEIARFRRSGHGIDPDQDALKHKDAVSFCGCHFCAGTPIVRTAHYRSFRHYVSDAEREHVRENRR